MQYARSEAAASTQRWRTAGSGTSRAADDAASIYAIPERDVDEAAVHQLVERHVAQHATYLSKEPIAKHTEAAFQTAAEFARSRATPLIIDAGCGTGRSTLKLAERYPDHTIIGVDAGGAPVEGATSAGQRVIIKSGTGGLLAPLERFKRFEGRGDICIEPTCRKARMLKQRFQGHASLPSLLQACGHKLTVRASWRTYLDEFSVAFASPSWSIRPDASERTLQLSDLRDPLTLFERKYATAGVPVYELVLDSDSDR